MANTADKNDVVTGASEWKQMFADERVFIWFDWLSMPQSGATGQSCWTASAEEEKQLKADGKKAIHSIPAYIERSDCMVVLAPGGHHEDRDCPTSYATWKGRGCVRQISFAKPALVWRIRANTTSIKFGT